MAMQTGKGAAQSPGADPSLTDDRADEIAACFHPAWDVEEPDETTEMSAPAQLDKTSPAVAASPVIVASPAVVASPVIVASTVILAGGPPADAPRAREPGSKAVEPVRILDVAPAPNLAPALRPAPAAAAEPAAPRWQRATSGAAAEPAAPPGQRATSGATARRPVAATWPLAAPIAAPIATPAKDPFRTDSGYDIVVPKRSKGLVFAIVGLGIAASVGVLLKWYVAGDGGKPAPAHASQAASPAPTIEEIPPPSPRDDPAGTTTVAKADPPTIEPAKVIAPASTKDPAGAQKDPTRPIAAAQPPPRPPHKASPTAPAPAPRSEPKTAPKSTGGAIVRDNPF